MSNAVSKKFAGKPVISEGVEPTNRDKYNRVGMSNAVREKFGGTPICEGMEPTYVRQFSIYSFHFQALHSHVTRPVSSR